MQYIVSKDIINKADKCTRDFSCLYGDKDCICDFEDAVENKILFIKPIKNIMCDYRVSFGYSYICSCPVRKELYNSYNV